MIQWLNDSMIQFLAGQLAKEFLLVHAVLEGFAAVDEDHRDLVGKPPPQVIVSIDVYVAPVKTTSTLQLGETLLDNLAQVAPFAGIHHHFSRHGLRLGTHRGVTGV